MQRGIPLKIVHINVDPKRTETFLKRTQEIRELNGWAEGMIDVVDEPYRDLYQSVDTYLKALREDYPGVYFHVYVGALRTRFPYNMLHMSTDRFLRDALLTSDNVSLTVKQIDLETLPLPEGFKVTFEHATDHHIEEDHSEVSTPLPHA
jgi:hypothetical protein